MKIRWLLAVAPALSLLAPLPARAQDPPGCPPGEWFCDDGEAPDAAPDAAPDGLYPDADDAGEPPPAGAVDGAAEGDIDVRRPPPPALTEGGWSEGSGGTSPWSLALRVQGLMLDGRSGGEDARLGGIGASGRYAINPVVTLDLGLDTILGRDYNGYDRSEVGLSFSSLFFLNYNPVVRTYVLVGVNTSSARVDVRGYEQTWGYLGGQAGLGLEFTLDSRVALSVDFLGFMRGRTDSRAAREPEFTDQQGRVTNTSGGGLLRGGVNLRF